MLASINGWYRWYNTTYTTPNNIPSHTYSFFIKTFRISIFRLYTLPFPSRAEKKEP